MLVFDFSQNLYTIHAVEGVRVFCVFQPINRDSWVMPEPNNSEFTLGIDLGANSLGWAVVGLVDGVPANLIQAGVRVFEAGINNDPKSGKEETLNAQRRDARLHRRQLWRRARRLRKVLHLLQGFNLLPKTDDVPETDGGTTKFRKAIAWGKPCREWDARDRSEVGQDYFNWLDHSIFGSPWFAQRHPVCAIPKNKRTDEQKVEAHRLRQLLPYILRAAAVEEKLPPHLVGRAIYHLAQRRGFWSNRKRAPKKDEKPGEVEEGIRTLRSKVGNLTLGQYFARMEPSEERIRDQWTPRDMYQAEFKRIWERQTEGRVDHLTDEPAANELLYKAIFDQRPIKLSRGLVGQCEFESGERRAPAYRLLSQRFRLLQVVNNLKIRAPGGEYEPLGVELRTELIGALERRSGMSFKEVREKLRLSRRLAINLQRDKEEARVPGNDTGAEFAKVFGDQWFALLPEEQERAVADAQSILNLRDVDERRRRATNYLRKRGLPDLDTATDQFLKISFEPGYMGLSVRAMNRFMPLLKKGFQYGALSPHYRYLPEVTDELIGLVDTGVSAAKACEQVLNRRPESATPKDALPPVTSEEVQAWIGAVRNPIVIRALTELRKVVNAIVARYKRPTRIHIELLRELKKPKDAREKIWKENLSRAKRNQSAEDEIRGWEPNISRVKPKDIEKYRLWKDSECCPYCRRAMTPRLMFGDDSEYQIDHIIPFKRSLDDSFVNKVLCHTQCNRDKGDRTPYEAFSPECGGDPDKYRAMIKCVEGFKGDKEIREEKVRRFKMDGPALEEFLAKWTARQFNDSAYASRLAADYLGLLYGGRVNENDRLCVQVRPGGLTKSYREAWNLNSILGDGETRNGGSTLKPRHDHRHHAVDAAVIAVADQDMFTRLSNAAKHRQLGRRERFGDFGEPWPGFRNELSKEVLNQIVVSHRVSGKVSGGLHKDKNYSAKDSSKGFRRIRIPVAELSLKHLTHDAQLKLGEEPIIVNPGVRERVLAKWRERSREIGSEEPKKVFSEGNLPRFQISEKRHIEIKKVRIRFKLSTIAVGRGRAERHVKAESNHHIEVFRTTDKKGRVKWSAEVVNMLTAYRRKNARLPIINPEGRQHLLFSLSPGEIIECRKGEHAGKRLVVRGMRADDRRIFLVHINDARRKGEMEKTGGYLAEPPSSLQDWDVRKIVVSPLGEVKEAHG